MPTDERADIQAATDRLLEGIPLRCDGKLTIVALAIEAGVKRHVLTHKHTDLRDRFNARVKAQNATPAGETALKDHNSELRRQLDTARRERDDYQHAADALARTLNVLTIVNEDLRRQITRTQGHPRPGPLTLVHPVTPDALPGTTITYP